MHELLPGLSQAPNIHPLVVHFPVALWTVALPFAALGAWRGRDDIFKVGRWLAYLGAIGAVVAVATGYWATAEMGHDAPAHDLVHVHRDFMVVALILGLVTVGMFAALRKRTSSRVQWMLVAVLALTVGVMTLGADRGAALVFRFGVGVSGETALASVHQHGQGDAHGHEDPHGHVEPSTPAADLQPPPVTVTTDAGPDQDADVEPREAPTPGPTRPASARRPHKHLQGGHGR